jgi:hypothetical protein
MSKISFYALILLSFSFAGLSFADSPQLERQNNKVTLSTARAIHIENQLGDVRLRFGGKKHVFDYQSIAQGSAKNAAPSLSLTQPKSTLEPVLLRAAMKAGEVASNGERIDISAFIPEGHAVSIQTFNGLVEVRSLLSDVSVRTEAGEVKIRGTTGALDIQSKGGDIEIGLETSQRPIRHRVQSDFGQITLSMASDIHAAVEASTSGLFGTEFSLEVTELPGQEPNKIAHIKFGQQDSTRLNQIQVMNKRGAIRFFRRREFNSAD